MPKLLDLIKEKNLTHKQVIELIEKNYKPEDNTDESDDSENEDDQIDKADLETDQSDSNEELDKEKALIKKLADEEEVKIDKLEADKKTKIVKLVQEELKRRGKITRRSPSKGELKKKPTLDYKINTRGYEVKTIRKKD